MLVSSRRLEALRERELYTRDLIGLRALDRRGKLHFAECDCAHRHVPTPSCRVQVWDRATKKFLSMHFARSGCNSRQTPTSVNASTYCCVGTVLKTLRC